MNRDYKQRRDSAMFTSPKDIKTCTIFRSSFMIVRDRGMKKEGKVKRPKEVKKHTMRVL